MSTQRYVVNPLLSLKNRSLTPVCVFAAVLWVFIIAAHSDEGDFSSRQPSPTPRQPETSQNIQYMLEM
uniref:Uncharacterized protein n=1 Tax=Knipowitschia caucasica TaxID=637954 RepID=A0AAV2L2X6_KNICA